MSERLSQKQTTDIAIMWAAAMVQHSSPDSFDDIDIIGNDVIEIIGKTKKISKSLLDGRPLKHTLTDIITHVKNQG